MAAFASIHNLVENAWIKQQQKEYSVALGLYEQALDLCKYYAERDPFVQQQEEATNQSKHLFFNEDFVRIFNNIIFLQGVQDDI